MLRDEVHFEGFNMKNSYIAVVRSRQNGANFALQSSKTKNQDLFNLLFGSTAGAFTIRRARDLE